MAVDISKLSTDRHFPPDSPTDMVPLWVEATFTGAEFEATDEYVLYGPFPDNSYLWLDSLSLRIHDADDGANLVFDLTITDVDGVADTVLIDDSTAGQAGGRLGDSTDYVATLDPFIAIGGKYLTFEVTVAAAGAAGNAGDVEIGLLYTRQVVKAEV